VDHVYAAARAAAGDDDTAAEVTRRVLVADPDATLEVLTARGACLAANRAPGYAQIPAEYRDAIVLARVLGWKTDRIAHQLGTTPADVRTRLSRGLRTLLPPRDCAAGASPAHGAHAS
jgi:DNA-directed RNA polymerase specialized sigma24 family protein